MAEPLAPTLGVAFGSGVLFALGLGISGMTNPAKVIGFLDIGGNWDPSLLCVMGAAVPVHAAAWWLLRRRGAPVLGGRVPPEPRGGVTARLVGGAALFGVGWGLSGVCPGPGVVNLAATGGALIFVPGMVAGVLLARLFAEKPLVQGEKLATSGSDDAERGE